MRHRAKQAYVYAGQAIAAGDIVEMPEGARRVRLHTRAFIDNHLHEGGDVAQLAPGVEGPHKSRTVSHDKIDYGTNPPVDANRLLGEVALDPLFDVIEHDPVTDEAEAERTEPVALLDAPDAERTAEAAAELDPGDQVT